MQLLAITYSRQLNRYVHCKLQGRVFRIWLLTGLLLRLRTITLILLWTGQEKYDCRIFKLVFYVHHLHHNVSPITPLLYCYRRGDVCPSPISIWTGSTSQDTVFLIQLRMLNPQLLRPLRVIFQWHACIRLCEIQLLRYCNTIALFLISIGLWYFVWHVTGWFRNYHWCVIIYVIIHATCYAVIIDIIYIYRVVQKNGTPVLNLR